MQNYQYFRAEREEERGPTNQMEMMALMMGMQMGNKKQLRFEHGQELDFMAQ